MASTGKGALYIGQKCYSSWSLRPWIMLKEAGFSFEEVPVDVNGKGFSPRHQAYSPNGLVPCLHLPDATNVWDSLAIMEWLAEQPGIKPGTVWPVDPRARTLARCISAEMHSGFPDVRACMPMNVKMLLTGKPLPERAQQQLNRIFEIWTDARKRFGEPSGAGPYLFGSFTAADAMYAPIAFRIQSYNPAIPCPTAKAYYEALLANEHMKAWQAAALTETNAIAHYDAAALDLGGDPRPRAVNAAAPAAAQ